MRRRLVVGNWKMNGSLVFNSVLLDGIKNGAGQLGCDVVVCVPMPYLAQCHTLLSGSCIALGAQDLSAYEAGAYTGEVSAAMLLEFGCKYVIVGHSERRAHHGENSELVGMKAARALEVGLTPIICVGETLKEHDTGRAEAIVGEQMDGVLAVISGGDLDKIVVAYEPLWAIGTGQHATPQMAQEIHVSLRAKLASRNPVAAANARILYGGSMKPDNAKELLSMPDVDGGLIGGAALKAADFLAILRVAN